jgi:hypothetical protein
LRKAEPSVPWHVSASGTYGLEIFARDLVAHGPGLMFDVRRAVERAFAVGLRFEGQVRFPLDVQAPPLEFRLESWAARVLGLIAMKATSSWSAEAAFGGGFDIEHVVPTSAETGAQLSASSVRAAFVVRAGLWFVRTTPFRVGLGIVVDFDTSGASFDAIENGARRTLFSANVVRPGLILDFGAP